MKKIKIGLGILIAGILVVSGVTAAAGSTIPVKDKPAAQNQIDQNWKLTPLSYYVESDSPILKAILGVNHQFDGVFSTELGSVKLGLLKVMGVKTKPVQIYRITDKPVCGDGTVHPSEKCGEPGLSCPEGSICLDCKCVEEEEPPAERTCYPSAQTPWGIDKVYGDPTNSYTPSGGEGIMVAVLDTGVDTDHMDLAGNIKDCVTKVTHFVPDSKSCEDGNGHGTHVSGTVLANAGLDGLGIYGVAPQADLMTVKVCDKRGWCYGDDIAAGIYYAADNGANIISMSISGDTEDLEVKAAITYAVGQGLLIVAAAGNDGPEDGSIDYPAANSDVIAVGAIDINKAVPDWSSRGINDGDGIIEEKEIEFGAPGVSIESAHNNGCYETSSGTSMATPHVSGLAAKLWQGDAAATRSHLQSIASDIWEDEEDTATGLGLPITNP
ncbi:S8 family peptidase [Candidatus Parcubacteria bacterium]|nr:S8 family peptidase [Candidatus Parcubacteria bacterium]